MDNTNLPDLTFPAVHYGRFETPLDLRPLLYQGGASAKANLVSTQIAQGVLGAPLIQRLPLVEKLHEHIKGNLAAGGSRGSAQITIRRLREFFAWADNAQAPLALDSVTGTYIAWTDHLLHRQRVAGDVSEIHVYQVAVCVAKVLSDVLQLRYGILSMTRMRRPSQIRPILGVKADKQNIEHTFAFGHALLDITNALSVDSIKGKLPVTIHFRTGQVIEEWLKLKPFGSLKTLDEKVRPSTRRNTIAKRNAWEADTSLRTRHALVNLRIEAEMLIFIAQTGMNLEQAHTLKMNKFRYRSHLDGYQVYRVYKGRRHGEVAFDIFSEYREIFENYLAWRKAIFPEDDDGLLFPLVRAGRETRKPSFSMVMKYCEKLGIRFVPPRELRKTRINWFLRRSQDPAITAEMHAHTQETLIRHYEQPSLQVAMAEINRFHMRTDPAITPPGPGLCIAAVPQAVPNAPPEATVPDCISPAGCLFCLHHRDIDSADHMWSLASYRHLKSLELARYRPPTKNNNPHPAAATVVRITNKLKQFEQSSEVRRLWVREALMRVEEDNHHPNWEGFIRLIEEGI